MYRLVILLAFSNIKCSKSVLFRLIRKVNILDCIKSLICMQSVCRGLHFLHHALVLLFSLLQNLRLGIKKPQTESENACVVLWTLAEVRTKDFSRCNATVTGMMLQCREDTGCSINFSGPSKVFEKSLKSLLNSSRCGFTFLMQLSSARLKLRERKRETFCWQIGFSGSMPF